jgi:cytochrome P450
VESVLRTAAPFHFAPRVAKTAIELDGREIRPGQRVVLNLLAAGLQQCPVTGHSDAREHFAFGAGTHYCLGATMSRVHIAAVLPVLIRVGLPARIDLDRLVRRRSFGMSAFEQVPFTADGRTARPDDGAQEA